MIASLPDLSAPSGWPHAAGTPTAPAAAAEGAGLDFAGLLGTAFVPFASPKLPVGGNPVAGEGEPALATTPAVLTAFSTAAFAQSPLTGLPVPPLTGKVVPEGGASLPPAVMAPRPEAVTAPALTRPLPQGDALLADPVDANDVSADAPDQPPALFPPAIADEAAAPPVSGAFAGADPITPRPSDAKDAASDAPADTDTDALPVDPAQLAALVPAPTAPPVSPPARLHRAGPLSPADRTIAPLPARVTLPSAAGRASPAEDAPEAPPASLSAPASAPAPAPLPATDSAPQLAPPAPTLAAPAPTPATPAPDRIEAPRTPAPQQESAIAQVGDLREALRSARPEMTLRHAEFGFVSLRLEQPAPEQWRAVLASRDPGFVPAIQTALAERAVAAASASADTGPFMGQNGTPQNGSGDHRYGASPNGGQGSLSPYMGQSGQRDGEAAPDHRRTSTAAALAARGQDGEEGSGADTHGLFA